MTNREKYTDEIIELFVNRDSLCEFARENILTKNTCNLSFDCERCSKIRRKWLEQEYIEPPIDWTKVEVDTKILISDDGVNWYKRYFAKHENREVFAFAGGTTSWSSICTSSWKYAKLAEEK